MSNDGGPAFPFEFDKEVRLGNIANPVTRGVVTGMSLRDYFAAAAMQGEVIASISTATSEARTHVAERAYQIADAMLEARKQ